MLPVCSFDYLMVETETNAIAANEQCITLGEQNDAHPSLHALNVEVQH